MKPWERDYETPAEPWNLAYEDMGSPDSAGKAEKQLSHGDVQPTGGWIPADVAGVTIETVQNPEGKLGTIEADGKMEAWTPLPAPTLADPFPEMSFQTQSGAPQESVSSFDYTKDEIRLKQIVKDAFAEVQSPTPSQELSSREEVFSFTKKEEATKAKSYTLSDKKSGVTVASGLDVGQWNEAGLKRLGISDTILTKMEPYIGKKGDEARALHKELGGFKLTSDEVKQVDTALENDAWTSINADLEKKTGKTLDEYPIAAQKVMVSMYHNFGARVFKYGTWKALIEGDYEETIRRLRNKKEWRENHARRAREAQLLAEMSTPTEAPPTLAKEEQPKPWERNFGAVS